VDESSLLPPVGLEDVRHINLLRHARGSIGLWAYALSFGHASADVFVVSSTHPDARSPRRALLSRLALIVVAVGIGLVLQQLLRTYLADIQDEARTDLVGARAELAHVFQAIGIVIFGTTGFVGVSIVLACRRAARDLVFPPPGLMAWGGARQVTGPRARLLAQIGTGLGATLVAASAAGAGVAWYIAAALLACRAGVPH
jgi:hypothetical protein